VLNFISVLKINNCILFPSDLTWFNDSWVSGYGVGHLAMIAWVVITLTMVGLAINRYVAITRPHQVVDIHYCFSNSFVNLKNMQEIYTEFLVQTIIHATRGRHNVGGHLDISHCQNV
jgi:hypothetical protein